MIRLFFCWPIFGIKDVSGRVTRCSWFYRQAIILWLTRINFETQEVFAWKKFVMFQFYSNIICTVEFIQPIIYAEAAEGNHTVWNELCHGPDISRYEPVFLRKTEVWRGIRFRTRSVYIEYQDPYFSWIELFPRHGISDIRTRHWNAACQDL